MKIGCDSLLIRILDDDKTGRRRFSLSPLVIPYEFKRFVGIHYTDITTVLYRDDIVFDRIADDHPAI